MKWLCPNDQSPFKTLQLTKNQQEEEEETDKIQNIHKRKKANTYKSYQNKPKPIKL